MWAAPPPPPAYLGVSESSASTGSGSQKHAIWEKDERVGDEELLNLG
jgi:hypothetical protein